MNVHENYGHVNRPRIIVFLLALLMIIGHCSKAQTKTVIPSGHNPNQIVKFPALAMDSVLYLPKGCGTPPLAANYQIAYRGPMIYFDTCNTVLYVYNPHAGAWGAIANSADLNAYLKLADTAAMLGPYARTAAVTSALALKLDITTAATTYFPIPTGTTSQYIRGNGSLATFPTGLPPTGAASGDLSGTYPSPNVVWANGYGTYDLRYYPLVTNPAGYLTNATSGLVYTAYVSTTTDLIALTGTAQTCVVNDSKVGGVFYLVNGSYTVDNALIFSATGRGAGYYWVRQITDGKYYAQWWGIDSTASSTNNQRKITAMLNAVPNGSTVYFERGNKLLTDSTIYVHGKSSLSIDGINSNRDSTRTYLTNWVFDTCNNLSLTNSRFWGAANFNADATRRSLVQIKNSTLGYLNNNQFLDSKKNGLEVISSSYIKGYNLYFYGCRRDGLSLSPAQYCDFYTCINENDSIGGMEFSDSTNFCGLHNWTAIGCLYAIDNDHHISGQANSNITVEDVTAIGCGSFINHGTPATQTVREYNWTFRRCTSKGSLTSDFHWAGNIQGCTMDDITILNPAHTDILFNLSNFDNLTMNNIKVSDSLTNIIITVSGGVLSEAIGYNTIIQNVVARRLNSTNSAKYAIQVDALTHVKLLNNTFVGTAIYAGNGINVLSCNDVKVKNNTVDTCQYGVFVQPATPCSGFDITDNTGSNAVTRVVFVNGTNALDYKVTGNTPASKVVTPTTSQASPYQVGRYNLWTETAQNLSLGTPTDTATILTMFNSWKTWQVYFGTNNTKFARMGSDDNGNLNISATTSGVTATINYANTVTAGSLSTAGTNTSAGLTVAASTASVGASVSIGAFKPSISSQSVQPYMYSRPATNTQLTASNSAPGFELAAMSVTTAGTGTHDFGGRFTVLPVTFSGTAPVTIGYTLGVFGPSVGASSNHSLYITGLERHDGLFNSNGVTLTANKIWVANTAGTAMTGATVEELSVPKVVASGLLTAQTATTNIVTYTTGAADSTFDISGRLTVTSFTAGTVQLTVNYTDETSTSRTGTFFPMGLTTAALSAAGASNFPVMGSIRVKASTTITVIATVTGTLTFTGAAKIIKLP